MTFRGTSYELVAIATTSYDARAGSDAQVVGDPGRPLGEGVVEPLGGVVVLGGDPADLVHPPFGSQLAEPGDQRPPHAPAAHLRCGEEVVEVEPALARGGTRELPMV